MYFEAAHWSLGGCLLFTYSAIFFTNTRQAQASFYNITEYARKAINREYSFWAEAALSSEKGLLGGLCPESPGICPPSRYRDLRGVCNNVRYPLSGSKGASYRRLVPPTYKDGVALPNLSTDTHFLPDVENIVSVVKADNYHEFVTPIVGIWGDFIKNDISKTLNPKFLNCCGNDSQHPECFSYKFKGKCHSYSRSLPASDDCVFDHRKQMNLATSFLDGSDLYGTEIEDLRNLRSFEDGKVSVKNCPRCNENSTLSFLYEVLLNHHNEIAEELSKLNSHWDDETIFEESRKIVVAEIQHITFNEFLPVVLGDETVESNNLKVISQGYFTGYSTQNKVNTFNEIATSVLPIFTTMYFEQLGLNKNNTKLSVSQIIRKVLSASAKMPSIEVLDLHRSRDHGVGGYISMKQFCSTGNDTYQSNVENDARLKELYRYPTDIDLSIGGLMEYPLPGALVGPTFACLLTKQFLELRKGDRFWYENDLPPSSFSPYQLSSLRRMTLSSILCSGSPALEYIQPQAFIQRDSYLNSEIACSLLPKIDLTPWVEEDKEKIPRDMLMQIIHKAEADVTARQKEEYLRWTNKGGVDPKSPVGTAAAFNKATKEALSKANTSLLYEFATEELLQSLHRMRRKRQIFDTTGSDNFLGFPSTGFGLNGDLTDNFQDVDLTGLIPTPRPIEPECPNRDGPEICDELTPFRTHSGYCNNLRNPHLGKSLATFARLLPPVYENGVSKPRTLGVNGRPLPSPRLVSTMIHVDISNLHNRYSLMLMQFSQFLDHDLTFTPVHKGFFASIPDCRSCDSALTVHPECMPIPIPPGDPHYPQINETSGARVCLAFMRSLPGQQHLGPREQINQNSAFIDAAHIYGEHNCQGRELRSGYGGRMNVTRHPIHGKELLPQSPSHPECKAPSGYCFIAGDGRASEQPGLTVIHTIFMREHNRIADGLQRINPHWDDNLLYEHARRIVSATWQHLVYNEYLPRLLGWNAINLYGLKLRPQGYYKGYSDSCNPNIVNEFATAAFRIGHSLLRPHIPRMSASYSPVDPPILLRNGFFNPDMIYQADMVDEITRGLITTPVETLDQFITGEITNHLFEDRRIPFSGIDLAALNIQRGRDHAIRSYNDYRALCNLKRARTFEDLAREIPQEVIARLKIIYEHVDDIDLFPGGMSERPVQGGIVGPTFACIIGIQFRQLKKCDRFWYETDNPVTKFTEQQLSEIRKITLSKVLCENMDHPEDIQRSAFDQPSSFLNPKVPCHAIPDIDLNAWRDTIQGCNVNGRKVLLGSSAIPTPCTSCVCTVQGMQCASLRVTDCSQLLREWSKETVLRDDVCTTQCGFLLQEGAQFSATLNTPTKTTFTKNNPSVFPSRPGRARKLIPLDLIPPPPRPVRRNRVPVYTGFKFPPFFGG